MPFSPLAQQVLQPPDQNLTTGPIKFDPEAIRKAEDQLPQRQILDAMLWLAPFPGGMGVPGMLWKALRNPLLRDMRLEWMFRR